MNDGPTIRRGQSKQDYQTPPDFMAFVRNRFGPIAWDLAASQHNAQSDNFYTQEHDSLRQDWHQHRGLLWLNPPFDNIAAWVKKCCDERVHGAEILLLVPASVGANWFRDYVYDKSEVYFLNGRITFVGCKDPYIKDCLLAHYNPTTWSRKISVVKWK